MSLKSQIISDGIYLTSMTDEMAQDALYTRYSDDSTFDVKVILDNEKYSSKINESRNMIDSASAIVTLDFTPSIYDTLLIDNEEYKVDDYQKQLSTYVLLVSKNKVPTGHHTQSRFR